MAERKHIKIPTDFFDNKAIRALKKHNDAECLILLYLELLCSAYAKKGDGAFSIANVPLTDFVMGNCFPYTDIGEKLRILERNGLIERGETKIYVSRFWLNPHDRNSDRYREWRKAVFARDGFVCQKCGTKKDLQAHHIKAWKDNKHLRYDVANGITLCRKCHLEAHGGSWRG